MVEEAPKLDKLEIVGSGQEEIDEESNSPSRVRISPSLFVRMKEGEIQQVYQIGALLGKGAFASVHRVVHKKSKVVRAMKILKKTEDLELSQFKAGKFFKEIEIVKKLDHPNIMKVYELYQSDHHYYIITEYCKGGELYDKIMEKGTLSEKGSAYIIKQILSGLVYAHNLQIAHRDLKPENILLSSWDDLPTIKIIDWGTAQIMYPGRIFTNLYGTSYYIAPEILKDETYDEKCDIWSVGVILYILLSGTEPFTGKNETEILASVAKGEFSVEGNPWYEISTQAIDLVTEMLTVAPNKRPSAVQCLEHPWFDILNSPMNNTHGPSSPAFKDALSNMKKFTAKWKLQQATLAYMVLHLTSSEEQGGLLKIFQSLDKNGDGVLSRDEIREAYSTYWEDIEESKLDAIMENLDIDNSGFIDYTEFVIASMNKKKVLSKHNLEIAFDMFDKDGSGGISAEEIKEVLGMEHEYSDEVWDEIVREVIDREGHVSLAEFKDMMFKHLEH